MRCIHFEPKPNHLAKKNLFFPRGASFSACCGVGAGEGDSKGGVTSLTARIVDVIIFVEGKGQLLSLSSLTSGTLLMKSGVENM